MTSQRGHLLHSQLHQSYNDGGNEKYAFCSFQAIFSTRYFLSSDEEATLEKNVIAAN
jgi:hypothetical protein